MRAHDPTLGSSRAATCAVLHAVPKGVFVNTSTLRFLVALPLLVLVAASDCDTAKEEPAKAGDCSPPCTSPSICVNGACKAPQTCNPPCPDGQMCINGACKGSRECSPPCASGELCINGACKASSECNPECKAGESCVNGRCEGGDCTPPCPEGQLCVNKKCEGGTVTPPVTQPPG